jgi:hypothetical protein
MVTSLRHHQEVKIMFISDAAVMQAMQDDRFRRLRRSYRNPDSRQRRRDVRRPRA